MHPTLLGNPSKIAPIRKKKTSAKKPLHSKAPASEIQAVKPLLGSFGGFFFGRKRPDPVNGVYSISRGSKGQGSNPNNRINDIVHPKIEWDRFYQWNP